MFNFLTLSLRVSAGPKDWLQAQKRRTAPSLFRPILSARAKLQRSLQLIGTTAPPLHSSKECAVGVGPASDESWGRRGAEGGFA